MSSGYNPNLERVTGQATGKSRCPGTLVPDLGSLAPVVNRRLPLPQLLLRLQTQGLLRGDGKALTVRGSLSPLAETQAEPDELRV